MNRYKYVFFDLDGTLTDSGEGIMNGFAYAVQHMGDVVEDKSQYRKFVGPPLKDSFERVLGYSPEDAQKAIAFYRKYYNEMGGNLENEVYPGIEKLLSDLKAAGKTLVIATSKQERGTKFILGHFGLDKYFDFMAASNDTDRQHKVDVIRYAIEHYGIEDLGSVVMVGDRENDVLAAAEIGIDSVGVLYGYGDLKELTDAGATYIAETVEDIFNYIEK
jgi:phosphoglycolate phosphatase